MKNLKCIIAGGGTGGHIFPALAIAHEIKRKFPNSEILFVGANGKMEMEKVPLEGFKIIGLDIVGFNRSNLLKNLLLPIKLMKSRAQAKSIVKAFNPDIVIGVGGYASFPVLHVSQSLNIPTLIQEQNSYAGKTNKILARKANAVCVAYDNMEKFFPKEKIIKTGNPVRNLILENNKTKAQGLLAFNLNPAKKTVLIVGGSLGAASVNNALLQRVSEIANRKDLQLLWQTGKVSYEKIKNITQNFDNIHVHEFIKNMDDAYAAADLIVSRAGAMAISELCIVGKPVIFIPYPFAAEDHQTSNAQSLVDKNAAIMIPNSEADSKLVDTLFSVIADQDLQQKLSNNIMKEAKKDATLQIVNNIKKILNL